jgi:hypothetical protein
MVAKISLGNTLYGVLSYNQIKVDEDHAKVIFTHKMLESLDGKSDINMYLQSFEPYLLANKRTEKPVLHVSLNPDPKDVLSDEQLAEIAQIYMQKMGYGDQPFIVYKHEDIERRHIHIVSVLFRKNEQGRIYGATFIDHEQKCVFNGSRLGREFSANVFNDLFNGNVHRPEQREEHKDE